VPSTPVRRAGATSSLGENGCRVEAISSSFAETALVVFQDDVTLHEILQLAQVPGPGIPHGCFEQCWEGTTLSLLNLALYFWRKMPEKQRDLRGALAQRWHIYREYVETIVKILAQAARLIAS